ncbi:actin [Rhizophlyctis rosea]|nr:actin [Rhizophlyctis rosea]
MPSYYLNLENAVVLEPGSYHTKVAVAERDEKAYFLHAPQLIPSTIGVRKSQPDVAGPDTQNGDADTPMPDASVYTPPLTPLQRLNTFSNGHALADSSAANFSTSTTPLPPQQTFICGTELTKALADGDDVEVVPVIKDGIVTDWDALTALCKHIDTHLLQLLQSDSTFEQEFTSASAAAGKFSSITLDVARIIKESGVCEVSPMLSSANEPKSGASSPADKNHSPANGSAGSPNAPSPSGPSPTISGPKGRPGSGSKEREREREEREKEKERERERTRREEVVIDGIKATIGTPARTRLADILFNPQAYGVESMSIQEACYIAVQACEPERRIGIWENIVVTGGGSALKGMKQRLENELMALISASETSNEFQAKEVRIVGVPEYFGEYRDRGEDIACAGASIVAKQVFPNPALHITKADYNNMGPGVVHRKILEFPPAKLTT